MTKGAPIPQREEDIIEHSMKFYTYLLCLSGLAKYPEATRLFRHKNLQFKAIKSAIGITNDTVKLYLYYLEQSGKIIYTGEYKSRSVLDKIDETTTPTQIRNLKMNEAKRIWKLRSTYEKDGAYLIPRPDYYTPVPEETLKKLNEKLQCSELELKLYYTCCRYSDEVIYRGLKYKAISFELIRDAFKIKRTGSDPNKQIRNALCFLKAVGLIDFIETETANSRGAAIPSFRLKSVQKYVDYKIEEVHRSELLTNEEFNELCSRLPDLKTKIVDFN